MKFRLDHIGFVVENIEEFNRLLRTMGFDEMTEPLVNPLQKVSASFVNTKETDPVYIEVLEAAGEGSPVANFLKNKGGGLHHLCFEVDDVVQTSRELEEKGFRMVSAPEDCVAYDKNLGRDCASPSRISFFVVSSRFLIELIEKGK